MTVDRRLSTFLSDPRNTVRRPPGHVPIAKVREAANAAIARTPGPDMHSVENIHADLEGRRIPLRLYRPEAVDGLPAIVFAHGGGWVWGNLDTHDAICRHLAAGSGAAVMSVDYRLAPETGCPGQIDDVYDSLIWMMTAAKRLGLDETGIALCGDSAGGTLALSAAIRAAEAGIPLRHIALIYPPLDPECESGSQRSFAQGHMLTREAMRWFWKSYLGGEVAPAEALACPAAASTAVLGKLPSTTVAVAEFDILRDEGLAFADRLATAGVSVRTRCYDGMIHGFLSVAEVADRAEEALRDIASDIASSFAKARKGKRS